MKNNVWMIAAISLTVLSCGLFRPGDTANVQNTAQTPAASPSPVVKLPDKIVDVPSLMGKTLPEIKNIIPLMRARDEFKGYDVLDYEIVGPDYKTVCSFSVRFDNGKFQGVSGNLEHDLSVDTPEKLGDMLGVDLRSATREGTDDLVYYKDFKVNGVDLHPRFSKKDSKKGLVTFSLDTKY